MSEKTPVTLIQGKDTQIKRVRIGDVELKVQHAGPVMINGQMGVSMTLLDVNIQGEVEPDPATIEVQS